MFTATDYNIKPSNNGITNSNALNDLINKTIGKHSDLVLIYFPAGSYNFSETIYLNPDNNNLVFQGDGASVLCHSVIMLLFTHYAFSLCYFCLSLG